jgi:hypothetical protein
MSMTRRLAAALTMAILGACLAPVPASGGGWATVGVSSVPDGTRPGDAWLAELTILQHGRTPLEGVNPTLTIAKAGAKTTRTFRARATSKPGVYRVRVVFPSAGTWSYVVYDDFSAEHRFPPVRIGGRSGPVAVSAGVVRTPSSTDGGGGFSWLALGAALAAGLLASWIVVAERRRRPGGAEERPAG